MATELNMPQMGYDMQEGTLVRWLKAVGDEVSLGDPVAEIETDKAVVEFESTAEGVLLKFLVEEGTTVAVGEVIAMVGAEGEDVDGEDAAAGDDGAASVAVEAEGASDPGDSEEAAAQPMEREEPPQTAIPLPAATSNIRVSPVARRLAIEEGIDLRGIEGTGPGGRILRADVIAAAEAAALAQQPEAEGVDEPMEDVEAAQPAEAVDEPDTMAETDVVEAEIDDAMAELDSVEAEIDDAMAELDSVEAEIDDAMAETDDVEAVDETGDVDAMDETDADAVAVTVDIEVKTEPDVAEAVDEPDDAMAVPDVAEAVDEPDDAMAVPDVAEAVDETDDAMAETDDVEAETDDAMAETDDVEAETDDVEAETDDVEAETDVAEAETDVAEAETDVEAVDETDDVEAVDEPDVAEAVDEPDVAEAVDEPDVAEAVDEPDVAEAVEPDLAAALPEGVMPLSRMRRQIARVTTTSKTTIPHFYVTADIDMTDAMALRRQINDTLEGDLRVSVNDLVIKACVDALKRHPNLNAMFTESGIHMHESINIGIAISAGDGLIMPAILDCGGKSLSEISAASQDLARRSQSGTLQSDEYTGGTFSISNMGMFDVTSFVAIIQPPQSAVLAVGTVQERPVVQGGEIVVREMMSATLSVDHRVSDGVEGAQFIADVKQQLERPLRLLL